jgi:hypothetical protein
MDERLSTMSLDRIIARLVGQAEPGEPGAPSPAEGRAVSQRLRAIVDGDVDERDERDRGLAADALTLAAYLDGSMSAPERDAFEAELTRSPSRRDDLIAAAAWIDQIAARRQTPPAEATALAIALEQRMDGPAARRAGFTGFIEWLLPRPRLAIATSALASIAIVAVGIDIALHTSPQFRQAIQPQSPALSTPGDSGRGTSTRQPSNARPERPFPPPAPQLGDPVVLTAETINALLAYRDDPSPARQKELLAALERAGSAPIAADQVRAIMLQPQLYERLTQPRSTLPTWISARLTIGGELAIAIAK